MGKISKALEKAQNKPAYRPKRKPAPLKKQVNKTIMGGHDESHVPHLDTRTNHPEMRTEHGAVPTTIADDQEIEKKTGLRLTSDDQIFPTNQVPNASSSNQQNDFNETSNEEYTAQPPSMEADAYPSRDFHGRRRVDIESEEVAGMSDNAEKKKRVHVQYSKTKVQISDPEKLKNNKVLSIFEDIETTNQFKMLRTQVLRKLKAIGGNSILVTSANPCEGKTFTSINLGVSIAKEFDRTVLIIDADVRRPLKQHTDFATEFFSLNVDKGLTDYLEGEAEIQDILINPGIDKLTLIPGGMPVDNSPELLNSARMEKMMSELKSRYKDDRLVILDGPAILHFPDAMILYKYVDGVLPVIESESTSAEDVKKMMELLSEVNILGAVMNKNRG